MRIAMNKTFQTPTFYRLGPAILLCSFLLSGCASSPTEIRYDDSMKTYTTAKDENATANYIIRPGNRPPPQPKMKQTATMQQSAAPEIQASDLTMVLDASDILFEFDKWVLRADVVPELDQWAMYLQNNPEITAEIDGHADSTGPTEYNQKLSERRAEAVINYLVEKGVDRKRLTAKAFGESQPVAPNTTKEGRQKNRRVELEL